MSEIHPEPRDPLKELLHKADAAWADAGAIPGALPSVAALEAALTERRRARRQWVGRGIGAGVVALLVFSLWWAQDREPSMVRQAPLFQEPSIDPKPTTDIDKVRAECAALEAEAELLSSVVDRLRRMVTIHRVKTELARLQSQRDPGRPFRAEIELDRVEQELNLLRSQVRMLQKRKMELKLADEPVIPVSITIWGE